MPEPSTLEPVSAGPSLIDRVMAWMKGQERRVLLAGAAFQITVLVAMMLMKAVILFRGETVLLRVVPVDPRDLLRGDYVILGYDFSRMSPTQIAGGAFNDFRESVGKTVYVQLEREPDGRHWHSVGVTWQPPQGRYIRGEVGKFGRVECGIESFFVQEGKGHVYEDAVRNGRLSAEIALTPEGAATLRRLVIENQ